MKSGLQINIIVTNESLIEMKNAYFNEHSFDEPFHIFVGTYHMLFSSQLHNIGYSSEIQSNLHFT